MRLNIRSLLFISITLISAIIISSCERISIRTVIASPKSDSSSVPTEAPIPVPSALPSSTISTKTSVLGPATADKLSVEAELVESSATNFVWLEEITRLQKGLAMTSDSGVTMFAVAPPIESNEIPDLNPTLLTSAKYSSVAAWKNSDEVVRVWDVKNNNELLVIPSDQGAITSLALSRMGEMIAIATVNNSANIWNITEKEIIQSLETNVWLSNLDFSPNNSMIAGVDTANFTVMIFDTVNGDYLRSLTWTEHASPALYGAYFSPDWKQIAWVARGSVQIMNAESGALMHHLNHEDFVNSVAWSPDGSLLASAAAGTVNGTFTPLVNIWDPLNGQVVNVLPINKPVTSLSFSPDGRELAILTVDGTFQIWSAEQ